MPATEAGRCDAMNPLTGADLLAHAQRTTCQSKGKAVIDAGYVKPDGRPAFTAFYQALLEAREGLREAEPTSGRPLAVCDSCPDRGIYVACLASYNAGQLHGSWIDLDYVTDAEDIRDAIQYVIGTSPAPDAEEYAIHDSSSLPGILAGTEWPDLDELTRFANVTARLTDEECRAYCVLCDDIGEVATLDRFRESFRGLYESPERFAMDWADEYYGDLLDSLPYQLVIDWKSVWRTLDTEGFSATYDSNTAKYFIFGV